MSKDDRLGKHEVMGEELAWEVFRRSRPEDPAHPWLAYDLSAQPRVLQIIQAAASRRKVGGDPAEVFISLLYDSQDETCLAAALGLILLYLDGQEWHSPRVFQGLRQALEHPNRRVQAAAIKAIADQADPAIADALVAALRNRNVGPNRLQAGALMLVILAVALRACFALENFFPLMLAAVIIFFIWDGLYGDWSKRGEPERLLIRSLQTIANQSPESLEGSRSALVELASPLRTGDAAVRRAAKGVLLRLNARSGVVTGFPISASPPEQDASELPVVQVEPSSSERDDYISPHFGGRHSNGT